jgi:hypothetical protein
MAGDVIVGELATFDERLHELSTPHDPFGSAMPGALHNDRSNLRMRLVELGHASGADVFAPDQHDRCTRAAASARVRRVRPVALAVAAKVDRDDAMVVHQGCEHAAGEEVAIERAGVAVHQHDRRAAALLDIADPHAVGVEELVGAAEPLARLALVETGGPGRRRRGLDWRVEAGTRRFVHDDFERLLSPPGRLRPGGPHPSS